MTGPPVFASAKPLIGMVHLLPLPGSPGWQGSMHDVLERALRDSDALIRAGFDGLLVENFGDAPFLPDKVAPETVAALTLVAGAIGSSFDLPLGINVLRNDAAAALAIAAVVGARFIRVNVHTGAMLTDQGWLEGRAHETLRARTRLNVLVAVCADVFVKHALPPAGADIGEAARETFERGGADVLIVSGHATGAEIDWGDLESIKSAVPAAPLWIGSGVTAKNARALLEHADGVIVGTAIKLEGRASNAVDPQLATKLVRAARGLPL